MSRHAAHPASACRSAVPSPIRRALFASLMALAAAGCTANTAEFAATLPQTDPKAQSPECIEMRHTAATWETGRRKPMPWTTGLLLGPYGLGIAAASHEHQARQRRLIARDLHLACSSSPLPADLVIEESRPAGPSGGGR